MTPVRFETAAPRSRVKPTTTELPLRTVFVILLLRYSLYLHFVMADAILQQGKETNNIDDIASVRSERKMVSRKWNKIK